MITMASAVLLVCPRSCAQVYCGLMTTGVIIACIDGGSIEILLRLQSVTVERKTPRDFSQPSMLQHKTRAN